MRQTWPLVTAVAWIASSAAPAHASVCKEFGLPSYEATRTIIFPDRTLTGKVYVSGERFREEMPDGPRTVIRMGDLQKTYTYDEMSKRGIVVPAPAIQTGKLPDKNDPNTRVNKVKTDTEQTFTVETKNGDQWSLLVKVVCRLDGVLLEQTFPAQVKDKEVTAKLVQSDIKLGPISDELFRVPNHIRLIEPPPKKQ